MQKKNILITGSSGYLGRTLLKKLANKASFNLIGLDIKPHKEIPGSINFINMDLKNIESDSKIFKNVDLICHCAGITNLHTHTKNDYRIYNVDITEKLYQEANKNGIKKIILTSSIAAITMNLFDQDWPVDETNNSLPDDEYGKSKKKQEEIALEYAEKKLIQTIAIRPCAFFEASGIDLGFRLTGSHMIIEDVVNAHISAINVLFDNEKSSKIKMFEAVFTTNKLPYKNNDKKLIEFNGDMRKIVKKYWPNDYKFIATLGFKKTIFSGVYNLEKSKIILNWSPTFNFDEWIKYCKKNNLNFVEERKLYQSQKSIMGRLKKIFNKFIKTQ